MQKLESTKIMTSLIGAKKLARQRKKAVVMAPNKPENSECDHPDYSLLSLVDEQLSLALSRRDKIARKADSRKRMELTMIWRACKVDVCNDIKGIRRRRRRRRTPFMGPRKQWP
jgi:hypothetical protein